MTMKEVTIFYPCEYHRSHPTHPVWQDCGCHEKREPVVVEPTARSYSDRAAQFERVA